MLASTLIVSRIGFHAVEKYYILEVLVLANTNDVLFGLGSNTIVTTVDSKLVRHKC